jgi:hypothetical protein
MTFQVLWSAIMKITAFYDIAPCSLIEIDRRFTDAHCLHHQGGEIAQKTVIFNLNVVFRLVITYQQIIFVAQIKFCTKTS